ncbi:hypothetical protein M8J76_002400 [Diaphorina citri]|nr:hypothetical protein M8J76_002400 [Diaphorina citri]
MFVLLFPATFLLVYHLTFVSSDDMIPIGGSYEETSFSHWLCRNTPDSENFCSSQMKSLFETQFHPDYGYLNVSQPYCVTFTRSAPNFLLTGDPQPTVTLGFRRCLIYGFYDWRSIALHSAKSKHTRLGAFGRPTV